MMKYYLLILLADCLMAFEFSFQKGYQKKVGTSAAGSLYYNAATGLLTALLFFLMYVVSCGTPFSWKSLSVTPLAVLTAGGMAVFAFLYSLLGFVMMKRQNMVLYTLFLMTGGMLIPYVYGIVFRHEWASYALPMIVRRLLGVVCLLVGVYISNRTPQKNHSGRIGLLIGLMVFLLNGGCSVFSNIHQKAPAGQSVSVLLFVALTGAIRFILCSLSLAVIGRKQEVKETLTVARKATPVAGLAAVVGGTSYLFQLIGAKPLDASVLYPMITGGTIVLSMLAGWLVYREKPTKSMFVGIGVCVVGTCLFL